MLSSHHYYNSSSLIRRIKRKLNLKLFNITNIVYRGNLEKNLNLMYLSSQIENSILNTANQPQMLTVTQNLGTKVIFFKSGKFHIMGKAIEQKPNQHDAHRQLSKYFSLLPCTLVKLLKHTKLECQTLTVSFSLGHTVNLVKLFNKLCEHYNGKFIGYCELDSFPALMLRIWAPVHLNVFASGHCILTGLKENLYITLCTKIRKFLCKYIKQQ